MNCLMALLTWKENTVFGVFGATAQDNLWAQKVHVCLAEGWEAILNDLHNIAKALVWLLVVSSLGWVLSLIALVFLLIKEGL